MWLGTGFGAGRAWEEADGKRAFSNHYEGCFADLISQPTSAEVTKPPYKMVCAEYARKDELFDFCWNSSHEGNTRESGVNFTDAEASQKQSNTIGPRQDDTWYTQYLGGLSDNITACSTSCLLGLDVLAEVVQVALSFLEMGFQAFNLVSNQREILT